MTLPAEGFRAALIIRLKGEMPPEDRKALAADLASPAERAMRPRSKPLSHRSYYFRPRDSRMLQAFRLAMGDVAAGGSSKLGTETDALFILAFTGLRAILTDKRPATSPGRVDELRKLLDAEEEP